MSANGKTGRPASAPPHRIGDVFRALGRDMEQYLRYSNAFLSPSVSLARKLSVFLTPPVQCCLLYRLAHWLHCRRLFRLARLVGGLNGFIHKASISPASVIGGGLYIPHTVGVTFHGRAGERLTLFAWSIVRPASVRIVKDRLYGDCPVLGDGVTVGVCATVSGGVSVGDGTIVGGYAVVTESVPPGTTLYSPFYRKQEYRVRTRPAEAAT